MKIFYVVLCISAVIAHSYAADESDDAKSYEECLAESGIKESDLEKLKNAKDNRLRCIMACVMDKEGLLADDKIDVEAMKNSMVEEIADVDKKIAAEIVDTCMNMTKGMFDICDISNIVGVCIKEQFDKMNIKLRK